MPIPEIEIDGKYKEKASGQTMLSHAEKQSIVQHIMALSTYGFPLNTFDLRIFLKTWLVAVEKKWLKRMTEYWFLWVEISSLMTFSFAYFENDIRFEVSCCA